MLFRGEKEAVDRMLADAKIYGYGNFIAHLKRAWVDMLVRDGISRESAIRATNVAPYPKQESEADNEGGE
jgi:hypothetical protein